MPELSFSLKENKKIYFASDFHLGYSAFSVAHEIERERKFIRWLESIEKDAHAIFLVGDIFDFWFEYKHAIPKGFVRFLGKIASLIDNGIPVYFFTGNHDLWMFDYFTEHMQVEVFKKPIELRVNGLKLLVGHGDGLGPGDSFYKLLKLFFTNRLAQRIFRLIHPDFGISIAKRWSKSSRIKKTAVDEEFIAERESLIQYCKKTEAETHHDLYIFGHRHLPIDMEITKDSRYYNIGEWIYGCTYGEFDGKTFKLLSFEDK